MKYVYAIYYFDELFAITTGKKQGLRRVRRLNECSSCSPNQYKLKRFNVKNGGYPNEAETITI